MISYQYAPEKIAPKKTLYVSQSFRYVKYVLNNGTYFK